MTTGGDFILWKRRLKNPENSITVEEMVCGRKIIPGVLRPQEEMNRFRYPGETPGGQVKTLTSSRYSQSEPHIC